MAKVKVEQFDNDEVLIRYIGLTDFDGDPQEVVLRLRVWEGEDNFQLSIDTQCDSGLRFELGRPKDVTLNFEDIQYAEDWDTEGVCSASCSCQCDSGECDCNEVEDEEDESPCCGDCAGGADCDCDASCTGADEEEDDTCHRHCDCYPDSRCCDCDEVDQEW